MNNMKAFDKSSVWWVYSEHINQPKPSHFIVTVLEDFGAEYVHIIDNNDNIFYVDKDKFLEYLGKNTYFAKVHHPEYFL